MKPETKRAIRIMTLQAVSTAVFFSALYFFAWSIRNYTLVVIGLLVAVAVFGLVVNWWQATVKEARRQLRQEEQEKRNLP